MRQLLVADAFAAVTSGSTANFAAFASKAARKRIQQDQVVPFTKALSAFVEKMTAPNEHPDSATSQLNDKSLAKVLSFVKSLATASNAYPPAMADNVTFVIRDEQSGKARKVSTLLRTTGGDCSQAVGKSMASLFAGAGTPSLFYWDEGMWQLSNKPADESTMQDARAKAAAAGVPSSDPMTLQELEAVQAKMAAKKAQNAQHSGKLDQVPITDASFRDLPSMTSNAGHAEPAHSDSLGNDSSRHAAAAEDVATSPGTERVHDTQPLAGLAAEGPEAGAGLSPEEEAALHAQGVDLQALKSQIKKLAPLLAALAAVPWIDPGSEDGLRVPFIKGTMLDEVEGMGFVEQINDLSSGWDVRGGVTRLWVGERNFDKLLADKDPGSRIALRAVIDLTHKFEQDFGKKTIQA